MGEVNSKCYDLIKSGDVPEHLRPYLTLTNDGMGWKAELPPKETRVLSRHDCWELAVEIDILEAIDDCLLNGNLITEKVLKYIPDSFRKNYVKLWDMKNNHEKTRDRILYSHESLEFREKIYNQVRQWEKEVGKQLGIE